MLWRFDIFIEYRFIEEFELLCRAIENKNSSTFNFLGYFLGDCMICQNQFGLFKNYIRRYCNDETLRYFSELENDINIFIDNVKI